MINITLGEIEIKELSEGGMVKCEISLKYMNKSMVNQCTDGM